MKKIALAALLLFAGPSGAFCAGYDDLNAGISYLNLGKYDDAIVWLDKAVADGDLIPDHLRVAHLDRGFAYLGKRDGQNALDAFTASIAAQPDDLTAYHERIAIYLANNMLEKAIADDTILNRLRPHDYATVMSLGRLNWYLDRPDESAAAFALFPQDYRAWLWLQLAHVRLGKPVDALDPAITAATPWPAPAMRFFHGDLSEADVLSAAANNKDIGVCEGNLFAAMWRRVHDDPSGARPLFEAAMNTCKQETNNWAAAKRQFDKLNAGAKAQ
jgi:tetratricopeptide (TPR) repeat protein